MRTADLDKLLGLTEVNYFLKFTQHKLFKVFLKHLSPIEHHKRLDLRI